MGEDHLSPLPNRLFFPERLSFAELPLLRRNFVCGTEPGRPGPQGYFPPKDRLFIGSQRLSRNYPIRGVGQPAEAAHPVPKTLPKPGFSGIIWLPTGTARIGHNGFSGQPLREKLTFCHFPYLFGFSEVTTNLLWGNFFLLPPRFQRVRAFPRWWVPQDGKSREKASGKKKIS
jgi:hypothetical protein